MHDDDMDKHNNIDIDIDDNNSAPTSGDGYKHNPNGQRRRMSPPKLLIIETSNRSHLSVHDAMNKRPKCQNNEKEFCYCQKLSAILSEIINWLIYI